MAEIIPPPVTDDEIWVCTHWVASIHAGRTMTGDDTCEDWIEFRDQDGKHTLRGSAGYLFTLADFKPDPPRSLIEPKRGLREKVEARQKWLKNNNAELATYRRLKAKYGEIE